MQIAARQSFLTGRAGPPLPYDAEVEYIEGGNVGGGVAFVDTGYCPNSASRIEAEAAVLSASGYSGRFGNSARLTFGASISSLYLAQGGHYFTGAFAVGTKYRFVNDIQNHTVSAGGATVMTSLVSDWYPQLYPFFIFASNLHPLTNGTAVNGYMLDSASIGVMALYSCKIFDNNVIVRDFIPVRVGSVGYLYDRVSGELFGNAGTGAFVIGPDK